VAETIVFAARPTFQKPSYSDTPFEKSQMSFDKIKASRNAQKYLQQGKTRAAIDEYKKIAANDPGDVSTLNTLGDLYIKASMNSEAIRCFKEAGEYYIKHGYSQKAIAIYNKIARHEPDSIEVNERLAALYWDRHCYTEARDYYLKLAKCYESKGRKSDALKAWKQIAQLDPDDTDILVKIGESYLSEGMHTEAAAAFSEAGERFTEKKKHDHALVAYRKALDAKPSDNNIRRGLVNAQLNLGFGDEAALMLEDTLVEDPNDREAMSLLADCYLQMEDPIQAERVITRLIEIEPSSYLRFLTLVECYIKVNDVNSAVRILSMTIEHLLMGGHGDDLEKWLTEIQARDREQMDAIRLSVRLHGYRRDEVKLKSALDRMMEVSRAKNSLDDERFALQELVNLLPHEITYAHRLQQILALQGVTNESTEMPAVNFAATGEVPTFESFHSLSENEEKNLEGAIPEFEGTFVESEIVQRFDRDPEPVLAYKSEVEFAEKRHAQLESFRTEDLNDDSQNSDSAFKPVGHLGASNVPNEFVETIEATIVETEDSAPRKVQEEIITEGEVKFSRQVTPVWEQRVKKSSPPRTLSTFQERYLSEELESVSYFVEQGFDDLAEKTLNSLEEQFGGRSDILSLRESLKNKPSVAAELPKPIKKIEAIADDLGAQTEQAINDPSEISKHENSLRSLLNEESPLSKVELSDERETDDPEITKQASNEKKLSDDAADERSVVADSRESAPEKTRSETKEKPAEVLSVEPTNKPIESPIADQISPPNKEAAQQTPPITSKIQIEEKRADETEREFASALQSGDLLGVHDSDDADLLSDELFEMPPSSGEISNVDFELETAQPMANADLIDRESVDQAQKVEKTVSSRSSTQPPEAAKVDIAIEPTDVDLAFDEIFPKSKVDDRQPASTQLPTPEKSPEKEFEQFFDFRKELGLDDAAGEVGHDFETHFELGIAYKEMGLYVDSIREFQKALAGVDANDGTRRHFETCNSIGYCFMEQKLPRIALRWYQAAFATKDLNDDERNALRYEIGNAYACEGKYNLASEQFEEIFSNDVSYRDVQERLEQLKVLT